MSAGRWSLARLSRTANNARNTGLLGDGRDDVLAVGGAELLLQPHKVVEAPLDNRLGLADAGVRALPSR